MCGRQSSGASVAELVDAADLKSADRKDRRGSSPLARTIFEFIHLFQLLEGICLSILDILAKKSHGVLGKTRQCSAGLPLRRAITAETCRCIPTGS